MPIKKDRLTFRVKRMDNGGLIDLIDAYQNLIDSLKPFFRPCDWSSIQSNVLLPRTGKWCLLQSCAPKSTTISNMFSKERNPALRSEKHDATVH
jgi:hypothetical protein